MQNPENNAGYRHDYPLETLTETFRLQADKEMNERQKALLTQMIEAAASYEN